MLTAFDPDHQRLDLTFDSAAELAKYLANLETMADRIVGALQ